MGPNSHLMSISMCLVEQYQFTSAEGFGLLSNSSKKLSCLPSLLTEAVWSLNLVAKKPVQICFSLLFQIILHIHHMSLMKYV